MASPFQPTRRTGDCLRIGRSGIRYPPFWEIPATRGMEPPTANASRNSSVGIQPQGKPWRESSIRASVRSGSHWPIATAPLRMLSSLRKSPFFTRKDWSHPLTGSSSSDAPNQRGGKGFSPIARSPQTVQGSGSRCNFPSRKKSPGPIFFSGTTVPSRDSKSKFNFWPLSFLLLITSHA